MSQLIVLRNMYDSDDSDSEPLFIIEDPDFSSISKRKSNPQRYFIHETQSEFQVPSLSVGENSTFDMLVPTMEVAHKLMIAIGVQFINNDLLKISGATGFLFDETNLRFQLIKSDNGIIMDKLIKLASRDNFKLRIKSNFLQEIIDTNWILRLAFIPIPELVIDIPPKNSSKIYGSWMEQGIPADVVILTRDKTFPCHKLFLAGESEYFLRMFKETEDNVLNWNDLYDASTVEAMIGFIYNTKKPVVTADNCYQLLELSHHCLMDDLKKACILAMKKLINPDRAAPTLQLAMKYNLDNLRRFTLNFIFKVYEQVKLCESWRQLEREGSMDIFFESLKPETSHF